MILEFLPEASAELYAAAEYYEQKEEGLGWKLRNEVLQVCQLIVQQPVLWRERAGGIQARELSGVSVLHRLFHSGRSRRCCSGCTRTSAAGILERQTQMTPNNKIAGYESPTRHVSCALVGSENSSGLVHDFGWFTGGRSAPRSANRANTTY